MKVHTLKRYFLEKFVLTYVAGHSSYFVDVYINTYALKLLLNFDGFSSKYPSSFLYIV